MNKSKSLRTLMISSFILLACIFSMSYKIMGIGFLQYVIILFLVNKNMFAGRFTVTDFVNTLSNQAGAAWKEKKRFKASIFMLVVPMMGIGLLFIVLDIVVMFIR